MDIYQRLPKDIRQKIFRYFRHPFAQELHINPWIISKIINKWAPPQTPRQRIATAKMVMSAHSSKRCGCIYYEQHQVCCNDIPEEELDTWDPIIKATPIQQAIQKALVLNSIRNVSFY